MDLFEIDIRRKQPRFTQELVEGLAYHELKYAMQYVENAIVEIKHSFPEGLVFDGLSMTDPETEVRESFISGKGLAYDQSNLYMCTARFRYDGEVIDAYLRLPKVDIAGRLLMDGKVIFISPVLSDKGVNIKDDKMFVRMSRHRPNFERMETTMLENGYVVSESIIHCQLHQGKEAKERLKRDNNKTSVKVMKCKPIFIYLLLNKGFDAAVREYFGINNVIVEEGKLEDILAKYPVGSYVTYSSVGKRPRAVDKTLWVEPQLHLIFREEEPIVRREIAANFFYLLDHMSSKINLHMLNSTEEWKVVAGYMLFSYKDHTDAKLADEIQKHLDTSINVLLDKTTVEGLHDDDIMVNDTYELMAWLIKNEKEIFLNKDVCSMLNKRLSVSDYVLTPIIYNINLLSYAFLNNGSDTKLTINKMKTLIKDKLREGLIRKIRQEHGNVTSVQIATDSMWLGHTRRVTPQSRNGKKSSNEKDKMHKKHNLYHPSQIFINQIDAQPPTDPGAREMLSGYVRIGPNGSVLLPKGTEEQYQQLLKRYQV